MPRNWDLDLAEALIRRTGTWRRAAHLLLDGYDLRFDLLWCLNSRLRVSCPIFVCAPVVKVQ